MNLGQPVIVENRNGASQMIAAEHVARAPADGSVLLLASQTAVAVSPVLQKTKSFDATKDFRGIGLIGVAPMVLVAGPSLPAQSVAELIAQARANPGKIDFGNGGVARVSSGLGSARSERALALAQHNGRLLLAGPSDLAVGATPQTADMVVTRLGSSDVIFSNGFN